MGFDAVVAEHALTGGISALAAGTSRRGTRIVAAAGQIPLSAASCYRIASLTKPLTAAATVLALHDRSVPLRTPAIELLPSLWSDWQADRAITVEQLLGQVSGLRESVQSTTMYFLGDGDEALLEGARLAVRAGSAHAPGTQWSYYNGNYFIVGCVLAAISGTTYEDALNSIVLRPWRLTRTGFETPVGALTGWDQTSLVKGQLYPRSRRPSGGLWSCVTDLLTFGERLLERPLLLEETRRPRTPSGDPMSYGLGWAIGPSGQMYLNGRLPGYRSAMLLSPDHGYASVALANQQHALPRLARMLSDLQETSTGDDLASDIEAFAE